MSSADTGAVAKAAETTATGDLEPSHIASIEVFKGAAAEQLYGKGYGRGVIIVTLDRQGTDAWLSAAAARATKANGAAPAP